MGSTLGVVGIFHGFFQPQLTIALTAFRGSKQDVEKYSTKESKNRETKHASGFVLAVNGYRPWFSNCTFC